MDPVQATDTAQKIAGDDPVLWALVVAVLGLVGALTVLWRAYLGRQTRLDDMASKNVEVMTAFRGDIQELSKTVERTSNSCNTVWSNIQRRPP